MNIFPCSMNNIAIRMKKIIHFYVFKTGIQKHFINFISVYSDLKHTEFSEKVPQ